MKNLRIIAFCLAIFVSLNSWAKGADGVINIVVTDFSYYYAGKRSETIDAFKESVEKNTKAKFLVSACACADSDNVARVINLLRNSGAKNIAVESLEFDSKLCSECE